MFGYIYKTTNIINNKIYVGQHKSEFFDKNYYGSGKSILKAFNKYGKKNFKCEIIDIAESLNELNEKEKFWIDKLNSRDRKIGYNIKTGGQLGSTFNQSEETKNKIKLNNAKYWKGKHLSEETKLKLSNANKGRKLSEEQKLKISNSNKGKRLSEETKRKISKIHKGKKYSDEVKLKLSLSHKGQVSWNKGIPVSEETKRKIAATVSKNNSRYWKGKNRSKETKDKISKTVSKINTGKKFITNGTINKFISPDEIEYYILLGFRLGRISSEKFKLTHQGNKRK